MKLAQLTFTRFIAAIAIVIFHFRETVFPFRVESIHNFAQYFSVLVSYFFVLSGFILTVTHKEKTGARQFYLNRFSRIYPLYIVALLLTLVLIFSARTPKDTLSFDKIFLSVFLIQSWFQQYALTYNFPAWSLSAEAFFYLLFPVVIYLARNTALKRQLWYAGLFWLTSQIIFMIMLADEHAFVLYNPLFHLASFITGIAAGKFFLSRYDLLLKQVKKLEWLSVISIAILIVLVISRNSFFHKFYENALLAPVFVLFIYTVALSSKRLIRLFSNKRLQYLGEISYGIYILQIPVAIFVFGIADRTIKTGFTVTFYLYLISLIVISAITHEVIEKPCRLFIRNRFIKNEQKLKK